MLAALLALLSVPVCPLISSAADDVELKEWKRRALSDEALILKLQLELVRVKAGATSPPDTLDTSHSTAGEGEYNHWSRGQECGCPFRPTPHTLPSATRKGLPVAALQ